MKTAKRIFTAALALILIVSVFSGCQGGAKKTDIGLLKDGVLQVGSDIAYPPFEFFADDGVTPMGLDIELAEAIGEKLGVKVEFINTAWDAIFSGLDVDKYDCVISSVTIRADRQETMDFSIPYIQNWQTIVVKKGSTPITSVEGLEGLKVGYQGETTSDDYLNDLIDTGVVSCETFAYDKVINCYDDLKLGRLDAVVSDSPVAEGYVTREPNNFEISWIQSTDPYAEAELFGVAVKKGNTKLQEAINSALLELENSGRLEEIHNAWLK